MVRRLDVILLCFMLFPCGICAQGSFQDAYNEFKKKAQTDYEDFRKQANQIYADWMRKAWEWYGKVEPTPQPKDDMLPPVIYDKEKEKPEPKPEPLPYEEVVPAPEPEPQPKPVAPIREDDGDYRLVRFQFFGTDGEVRLPKGPDFKINGRNENAYANAWEELSSDKYNNLIRDCLVIRMEHQLCDWAYLMMLVYMSETVCGKGTSEAVMMQGYLLCQSGYKIRFGFTKDNELRLLFRSDHLIYDLGGVKLNDGLYHPLQPIDDDGLYICDISFPDEKPLSLLITQEQKFAEHFSKERRLKAADKQVAIMVKTNENLLKFYDTYPASMIGDNFVSRWAMYANTPLSSKIKEELYPQLKAVISNFDDVLTKAHWLLYWVQTAFVYEYDDKVWGRDRAFFAEESLYYPYCDCEDRSILFSRLIRDLLGLNVILVYYPGHLATAVEFNTPVEGDYILLNNKQFTICDPTYIGAPPGVTMSRMDNKTAKVILLSK